MKQDLGKMKKRGMQIAVIFAVFALVSMGMPTGRGYDGVQEDGKYYWNVGSVANLQIHDRHSVWSVRDSDAIIDDYDPHKDWAEIRMTKKKIYAEPSTKPEKKVGYVRPYLHVGDISQPPGTTGQLEWPIQIVFVVYQPDYEADVYDYDLGGISIEYECRPGHEIRQYDTGTAFDYELGGTNCHAPSKSDDAEDYFSNVYDYALGKTLGFSGGDEIEAAIDMIRTWRNNQDGNRSTCQLTVALENRMIHIYSFLLRDGPNAVPSTSVITTITNGLLI